MKVKELKEWLSQFEDDEDVVLTSMDDYFFCEDFECHSPYDSYEQAQELIIPYYFERYIKDSNEGTLEDNLTDITGAYSEED